LLFKRRHINFSDDNLEQIISACISGNSEAQRLLINKYLGYAKSISYKYAQNDMEGEEIVNDGFLKIFNNLHKYDFSKPFLAWIRVIFTNTGIDYYRKNQKKENAINIEGYDFVEEETAIYEHISGEELLELIQKLPTSYRMVFVLYVVEGYSHKEIAEKLGIKEGTSKSNLQDARIKLQEMIKQHFPKIYQLHSLKGHLHEK
jgi:RNA polymerase sigma-70 factor (ECF subfamily)